MNTLKTKIHKSFRTVGPSCYVSELSIREIRFPSSSGQVGRKGIKDTTDVPENQVSSWLPETDPASNAHGLGTMERTLGAETKAHQESLRED